jgi:hypothetical protein
MSILLFIYMHHTAPATCEKAVGTQADMPTEAVETAWCCFVTPPAVFHRADDAHRFQGCYIFSSCVWSTTRGNSCQLRCKSHLTAPRLQVRDVSGETAHHVQNKSRLGAVAQCGRAQT